MEYILKCYNFFLQFWNWESTIHPWIPHTQDPGLWSFDVYTDAYICLKMLLYKQSSRQWSEMPWHSCDVAVMNRTLIQYKDAILPV